MKDNEVCCFNLGNALCYLKSLNAYMQTLLL